MDKFNLITHIYTKNDTKTIKNVALKVFGQKKFSLIEWSTIHSHNAFAIVNEAEKLRCVDQIARIFGYRS